MRAGTGTVFSLASWVLWARFVGEFLLRMVVAPSTTTFLKRNWWQLSFLAVGDCGSYGDALDTAALATIAGEPFFPEHTALRVVQILVVTYSVVVFAALAGAAGAFLIERRADDARRLRAEAVRPPI